MKTTQLEKANSYSTLVGFFVLVFALIATYYAGVGDHLRTVYFSIGLIAGLLLVMLSIQAYKHLCVLIDRCYNGWNKSINDFEGYVDSVQEFLPEDRKKKVEEKKPEETTTPA